MWWRKRHAGLRLGHTGEEFCQFKSRRPDIRQAEPWITLQAPPQQAAHGDRCVGGRRDQSGSVVTTAAIRSVIVSPAKSGRPVSNSNSTTPNAHTSVRRSTGRPRICSGDMYPAVPRITPATVPLDASVGDSEGFSGQRRHSALARPRFCESEVEDLRGPGGGHLHVGGLQIAVNDAPLVRRLQGLGNLPGDVEGLLHRKRTATEPLGEILALDEFEDQKRGAVHLLEAVDARDMRVVERGEHVRFAAETRQPVRVGRDLRTEHLDRHVPAKLRVPCPVDLAHAARAEALGDREAGQGLTYTQQVLGVFGEAQRILTARRATAVVLSRIRRVLQTFLRTAQIANQLCGARKWRFPTGTDTTNSNPCPTPALRAEECRQAVPPRSWPPRAQCSKPCPPCCRA